MSQKTKRYTLVKFVSKWIESRVALKPPGIFVV